MDAKQTLIHLVKKQTAGFIKAARCLPADKLEWKAGPKNRTPLDILQEVATVACGTPDIIKNRKMSWNPDQFAKYQQERASLTDVEDIYAKINAATDLIVSTINATDTADYDAAVQMPWPGDFRIVDILTYHMWNLGYHEGQLVYILAALDLPTPFDH